MEGSYERSRIIRLIPFLPAVLLVSLFSCAQSASLEMLLARIDQQPSEPRLSLFLKAAGKAHSTDEKLRVLKRLRDTDQKSRMTVVAFFCERQNTEPVITALIDYYLEAFRFYDAFNLFNANLSCSEYPELYAEIVLSAYKNNTLLFNASMEDLHRAGIETSQPVLLYCAALKCMAGGDVSAAGMFLKQTSVEGFIVPAGFLWDTGLSENLLVQESFKPDSEAFSYLISAAYIEGNLALTANIAQQFLDSYPHAAWQAYIALGMLAFQAGVNAGEADQPTEVQNNMDWPHGDIEQGYKELDNADYWFTEAYRLFPTRFEVCDAFIKWQALSGNIALIPEPADPIQSGEKIDRIRFFSDIHGESSQRVSALAVELAAKYPNSPEVINLVLFTLFKERSWDNFLQLLTQSKSKYSIGTTNVFYDIVARVCSGNTDSAIDGILKENSSDSYAYIYNLGLLEISLKHFGKAFELMKAAASKAPSIKRKAETLIHVSHIAKTLGKPELWEAYQRAAVSLDPDCLLIPENSALLYGE